MPSQARTNSFWTPFGPRHPLKMGRPTSIRVSEKFVCAPPPLLSLRSLDQETYVMVIAYVYAYIYVCKKRERDTNSWMLISTEASILRNQRFSIIINPRVRAVVRRKKIKEREKKERNNKKKKKRKKMKRVIGKCDRCAPV